MRTNIVIDDELMDRAMQLTGITTKRSVVEEALRVLIRTTEQKGILELQGKIQWEGDLDEMRAARYFAEPRVEYAPEDKTPYQSTVSDRDDEVS